MPDITMCFNQLCPIRAECKRNEDSGTEPFDLEKYDPAEDTHKMIIQAGWLEEIADE